MTYESLNLEANENDKAQDNENRAVVPCLLIAMLHEVCLNPESTHPLKQCGQFWFWSLSYFGMELMRTLVRASSRPFSYSQSFSNLEIQDVPQLVLLQEIHAKLQELVDEDRHSINWQVIFDASQYLVMKQIVIDVLLFQIEIDALMQRIREGYFEPSGHRTVLRREDMLKMSKSIHG